MNQKLLKNYCETVARYTSMVERYQMFGTRSHTWRVNLEANLQAMEWLLARMEIRMMKEVE